MGKFKEIKKQTVMRCKNCIWNKNFQSWFLCSNTKCRYYSKLDLIKELARSLKEDEKKGNNI